MKINLINLISLPAMLRKAMQAGNYSKKAPKNNSPIGKIRHWSLFRSIRSISAIRNLRNGQLVIRSINKMRSISAIRNLRNGQLVIRSINNVRSISAIKSLKINLINLISNYSKKAPKNNSPIGKIRHWLLFRSISAISAIKSLKINLISNY